MDLRLAVVIVDDEASVRLTVEKAIEAWGFEPLTCSNSMQALKLMLQHERRLLGVICDYKLHEETAFQVQEVMVPKVGELPFVIFSANVTKEVSDRFLKLQKNIGFAEKPDYKGLKTEFDRVTEERKRILDDLVELSEVCLAEGREILSELEGLVIDLHKAYDLEEAVNTVFRLLHTLKGVSGLLRRPELTRYIHRVEDLLTEMRSSRNDDLAKQVNVLLNACDTIDTAMSRLETQGPFLQYLGINFEALDPLADRGESSGPQSSQSAQERVPESAESPVELHSSPGIGDAKQNAISVPTEVLDKFMHLSGEMTVLRNMVSKLITAIESKHLNVSEIGFLAELLEEMYKVNSAIQSNVLELRKVRVESIYRPLKRLTHDLEAQTGKSVQLNVHGEELRIDAKVARMLSSCLVHLVRNAVDHGVEEVEVRRQLSKEDKGQVSLDCREEQEHIIVEVADDGRGIDLERVRTKAQSAGIIDRDKAAQLSEQETYALLFEPGFSTSSQITDVSGRGVGMDMVLAAVQDLGGHIDVHSQLNQGTRMTLRVPKPKSLVIIPSLMVRCLDQHFAIPQENILRLIQVAGASDKRQCKIQGQQLITIEQEIYPTVDLAEVLGYKDKHRPKVPDRIEDSGSYVLLHTHGKKYALYVDDILDGEQIVVKALPRRLADIGLYLGTTFTGDGTVGLILDVEGVYAQATVSLPDANKAHQPEDNLSGPTSSSFAHTGLDYLIFQMGERHKYALPLEQVERLERFQRDDLQRSLDQVTVVYRERPLAVFDLSNVLACDLSPEAPSHVNVIIMEQDGVTYGLMIDSETDISSGELDRTSPIAESYQSGSLLIGEQIFCLLAADRLLDECRARQAA